MDTCRENWSTYISYAAMRGRCENPKNISFKNYGAKGIRVCERWRECFANFLADMGPRPSGTSLDRRDNSLDYGPGNCKWSTRKEQNENKTCTYRVTNERGQSVLLKEYAETNGVKYRTALYRVKRGFDPLKPIKGGTLFKAGRGDQRQQYECE